MRFWTAALCLFTQAVLLAHKPSDSYLRLHLTNGALAGQWSISLRDLEVALGLDSNADKAITWGEVKAKQQNIRDLAAEHLVLHSSPPSQLSFSGLLIDELSDGAYAVLNVRSLEQVPLDASINYTLFFDFDAQHRGVMTLARESPSPQIFVFTPEKQQFSLSPSSTQTHLFGGMVREGVLHIWKGFDHLLFLFALLLPSVLKFNHGRWEVAPQFGPVSVHVAKVVTAFTVAHSITLTLATLEIVSLPSVLVESVIAGSVVFAALSNFYPTVAKQGWLAAFLFGLVHGFGFANVFGDLGLKGENIVAPLFAFNIGVELGQLAVVLIFLPSAFLVRRSPAYRVGALRYGSIAIALIASTWLVERVLNFKVLPF